MQTPWRQHGIIMEATMESPRRRHRDTTWILRKQHHGNTTEGQHHGVTTEAPWRYRGSTVDTTHGDTTGAPREHHGDTTWIPRNHHWDITEEASWKHLGVNMEALYRAAMWAPRKNRRSAMGAPRERHGNTMESARRHHEGTTEAPLCLGGASVVRSWGFCVHTPLVLP